MLMVNVHAAKTQLSMLLARMEAGEDIVIARNGTPVARLVPYERAVPEAQPSRAREMGFMKDSVRILGDVEEPRTDEEWSEWHREWDELSGPPR